MRFCTGTRGVFTPPVTKGERARCPARLSVWHCVCQSGLNAPRLYSVHLPSGHHREPHCCKRDSDSTPVGIRRTMSRLRSRLLFGDHGGGGIPDNGQGNPQQARTAFTPFKRAERCRGHRRGSTVYAYPQSSPYKLAASRVQPNRLDLAARRHLQQPELP